MKKEKQYLYEMDAEALNVLSLLLTAFMVGLTILIIFVFNIDINLNEHLMKTIIISILILLPYCILHEVLHSIGYVVNGADFKYITYGMHLEKGVLCCCCKQEVEKKTILWSLIYPFLFIGVITYIIGFVINSPILIILSVYNISGCTGDLIMFYHFLKLKDFRFFEYDNPIAFGLVTKENLDNKKFVFLKRIDEKVVQTPSKKITISKTSLIFVLFYYAMGIFSLLMGD